MIRPAQAKDADWIAAIWNAAIANTLVTFTTVPKTQHDIAHMISERSVLVLPDNAGFATYGPFRTGPGYAATAEHTILLAPEVRGQGRGATLLGALMDAARSNGIHVMVAGISGANPGAARFHARHGFEQTGYMPQVGRKHGQWLDLILMQKILNP